MSQPRPPIQHDLTVETAVGDKSPWPSLHHDKVSFRMRRLEPQLAWAIAAYTVWAGIFLSPVDAVTWWVALYAATIGVWCSLFPAHQQWLMLVRGILLLSGAFMLQTSANTGGPGGPYFIWTVMVTTVYALLMARRWAIALSALALVQFAAACVLATPSSWRLVLAQAGVLWFFPFVAMLFGRSIRELDQQVELARMDRHTRLYNKAGLFTHGAELFDECRRRKRPFAMVLLNSTDLGEASDLVGQKAANQLFAQLVQNIAAATPREGLAARTDAVEFSLALPGVAAKRAATLLHQHLGEPPKVELTLKGSKVTVMLDSVIAEATSDVPTLEDMYDRLHDLLLERFGPGQPAPAPAPAPAEQHTTLHGLLEEAPPLPHDARPTVPMNFGKAAKR